MSERLERLERAVAALEEEVGRLGRRLAAVEGSKSVSAAGAAIQGTGGGGDSGAPSREDRWWSATVGGTPSLIGRSLLILAGAFLLRALTESGSLSAATGVVLGLAYAVSWILAAGWAAHRGARVSAGFFAVCAALIADPLIFEASTEFSVLGPVGGAVILAAMTSLGLAAAARWRLRESAWVFAVGAMMAGAAMAVARPPGEAATAIVVGLGLAVVWMPGLLGWESLRWLTAVGADVGVLRLAAMASAPGGPAGFAPPHTTVVAALQGLLVVGYVGSSAARALSGRRPLRTFDLVQTAAAWAIGWGGALRLANAHGIGTSGLAIVALGAGLAAYAGAFAVVEKRQGRSYSYMYLTTLGLVLILLGAPGVFGDLAAAAWAIVALVAAAAGSRFNRLTLRAHAAVLLAAAWLFSGVAKEVFHDLSGGWLIEGMPGGFAVVVAVLTVATTAVVLFTRRLESPRWGARIPLTAMLLMSGVVVAATAVWVVGKAAPSATQWMGTIALSAAALTCALLASLWRVREAGWLVYPLLVLTGLRVLLSDLSSGRTIVLVVSLAAYGAALVLSARLLRTRQ